MASTIKVDNVQNTPGTNIINKCGATITVGAACNSVAVTGNIVKSNALQASDGGNIIDQCGTTVTVGASGDTVALAAGASSSGFGRTGAVDWDTTPKTATFSAVNGTGYFVNTTSGVVTANLPAGSAGDIVALSDYASTWDSNAITVSPDGTDKINGGNYSTDLTTAGLSVTLIYIDGTIGWKNIDDATTSVTGINPYVEATGGSITPITCGDYKIHVFTGPGALCVTSGGTAAPCSGSGSNLVDYLVIAGGGGGGGSHGGGGGGGGLRTFMPATTPMAAPAGLAVAIQPYAITVGGGGPAGVGAGAPKTGSDSIFSSITSAGGGGGGNYGCNAADGGSGGGGGGHPSTLGSGNTPPVSPAQGTDGGAGSPGLVGGGGGGASAAGAAAGVPAAGIGGDGGYIPDAMIGPTAPTYGTPGPAGSTRYWAGGGGGGGWGGPTSRPGAVGGAGGGADGSSTLGGAGCNAVDNTSGGGGGGNSGDAPGGPGGSGGSGLVVVRYKFQN